MEATGQATGHGQHLENPITQRMVQRSDALAPPGKLLKMQILGPYPQPTESESIILPRSPGDL